MNPAEPDRAKARFFIIQAVRLSGIAIVFFGLLVLAGKVPVPKIAGYPITGVGIIDAFIVPIFLSRAWKTPKS